MPPRPNSSQDVYASDDVVVVAAELLVQRSDRGWVKLMAQHADDGTGRCRSCQGPSGSHRQWPCLLWMIGQEAELRARRRATRS